MYRNYLQCHQDIKKLYIYIFFFLLFITHTHFSAIGLDNVHFHVGSNAQ